MFRWPHSLDAFSGKRREAASRTGASSINNRS
jgi:hypothetical protein